MNNCRDKLSGACLGWEKGPPPIRLDGELAIVQLFDSVTINGLDHCGLPIIVARWPGVLKTTSTWHQIGYEDVACHAGIYREVDADEPPNDGGLKRFVRLLAPRPV